MSVIPAISFIYPYGKPEIFTPGIRDTTIEDNGSFSIEGIPVQMEMMIQSALCTNLKFVDIGILNEEKIRTLKIGRLQPGEVLNVGEVFIIRETIPGFEDDNINWDGILTGHVTNESGDVMVGFDLEILYGNKVFHDVTDINGRYELTGLPRDTRLRLRVFGTSNKQDRTEKKFYSNFFDVICDGNDFDIELSPGVLRITQDRKNNPRNMLQR
jgi:hypothetical protein